MLLQMGWPQGGLLWGYLGSLLWGYLGSTVDGIAGDWTFQGIGVATVLSHAGWAPFSRVHGSGVFCSSF